MRLLLLTISFLVVLRGFTQPYLDIANVHLQLSPSHGHSAPPLANRFTRCNANFNIPFLFKKDSSILVISPFFDSWNVAIDHVGDIPTVQSLAVPVTFIKRLSRDWTGSMTAIARWNGDRLQLSRANFQVGAALLFTYIKRPTLQYKFGLYYNAEFSGPFFIPLFGIDWQPDANNYLFGVLPGNLVFEHRVHKRIFCGAAFRAITSSFYAPNINNAANQSFLRIDENQLGLFADFYLSKSIVANIEAGHSVLRQFRFGAKHSATKYYFSNDVRDNLLFKLSIAYRVRFR